MALTIKKMSQAQADAIRKILGTYKEPPPESTNPRMPAGGYRDVWRVG